MNKLNDEDKILNDEQHNKNDVPSTKNVFSIPDKVYDVLKWIAQILLPAIGTLYFTLASIWGFPNAENVIGTIIAIDTFIGVCLQVSTVQYNKQIK